MLKITVFLISCLFFVSCASKKKMVYFQESANQVEQLQKNFTPLIKVDDFLSILITAEDPETAIPFNLPSDGVRQSVNTGYVQGNPSKIGYLVDSEGNVNLPILGKIHLAGLNRMQATDTLVQMLDKYLASPNVTLQIENFKVTILGDVANPGTFRIPNERITLLEALGLAGDLKMTGKRKNILVIRDNDGVKAEYRVDLTSNNLFSSEVYYLQQNDVIYVEPNAAGRSNGTIWRTSGGIFISVASLIVTTATLITK